MKDDVQVSVCCATYNQREYVGKTLDGFLMQKTNFNYEIIIHDDASIDGTIDILKEYQLKYPKVIRLLLEDENQVTQKGIDVISEFLFPQARGKYIAFCEGDDFWIYDGKLQEQYDLMEEHEEISACYHNAIIYEQDSDSVQLNVTKHPSGYISDENTICTIRGWYPTASLFMRTEYIKEQPVFTMATGDECWRDYLACRGKLYFINKVWSVYRWLSNGGWNTRYHHDKEFAQKYFQNLVLYLKEFNEYSRKRFEKYMKKKLFLGVDKYRNAHYEKENSVDELRQCIEDLKRATDHAIDFVLDEYYAMNVIECRDYYSFMIEEKLKDKVGLYLYGAGTEAMKALMELDKRGMVPSGLIVSDKKNLPLRLFGIPIYEAEEFEFNPNALIWPCLINGREKVLKKLCDKKCAQLLI